MKNLRLIGFIVLVVFIFGSPFWGEKFSSWNRTRKTKNEIQRLIDDYGLENTKNPIEDFYQCRYYYRLYEVRDEFDLKNKDIFLVNCIPVIRDVLDKCEDEKRINEKKSIDERLFDPDTYWSWNDNCFSEVLDPLIIDK